MLNLLGFSSAMDAVAWRGLLYTVFILNFVLVCQLILLQPLVSALGIQSHTLISLFLITLNSSGFFFFYPMFFDKPFKSHQSNVSIQFRFMDVDPLRVLLFFFQISYYCQVLL